MPHLTEEQAAEMAKAYLDHFPINYVPSVEDIIMRDDIAPLKFFGVDSRGPKVLGKMAKILQDEVPDIIITSSGSYNIEINHVDAQKGIAIAKIAKKLGIKANEIMAIGDSLNDVNMLELAGISVAMENASFEIKDLSKYTTLSNDESGVAVAINKVLDGIWTA